MYYYYHDICLSVVHINTFLIYIVISWTVNYTSPLASQCHPTATTRVTVAT